jgi:hypothetical protein
VLDCSRTLCPLAEYGAVDSSKRFKTRPQICIGKLLVPLAPLACRS